MSSKPRDWPNNAKEARDQAAESAQRIVKVLAPLIDDVQLTETDRLRRAACALNEANRICRLLESVGAQTRA